MHIGAKFGPTTPLQPLTPLQAPTPLRGTEDSASFSKMLVDNVKELQGQQQNANQMVNQLLTGENVNEAEVLTAVQKADLTFQLMLQIRNKLMDAYQQMTNMQI